uniref:Uncharacterized protein n=1 Tax=Avena sativa TaxID=4498 RepID=A0ACD5WVR1_AVESA
MPPRRSSSGYRDIHTRPTGNYYAEIRIGDECIGLGMFETTHKAQRAHDVVAGRLGRPGAPMNFHDVWTREQAEALAPRRASSPRRSARQRALERRLPINHVSNNGITTSNIYNH